MRVKARLILLSEPVWMMMSRGIDEITRKVLIAAPKRYDSIRKHLAVCGYHTVEIREKYYL